MKYISLSLALSIAISGCQSTFSPQPNEQKNNKTTHNSRSTASPSDIHSILMKSTQEEIKEVVPHYDHAPIEYTNVWERIKHNLVLDIPINETVIKHRNNYLKHPTALNNLLKRSEPFIFHIIEQLEENNIPIEIALLPLVESAFDPHALSYVDAAGLWQFMPSTGKQFGLQQNWWYDGRRDVVASTQSAIKYLNYLNKFFDGDWMLALAAYNSGEGRVQRAMRKNARKNRPTHYWELELPKETRDYVPKLLAVIDIIKHSKEFNIKLHSIPNEKVVGSVLVGSQIDLSVAANLADLSLEKFKELNPGFNQWATDPDHSTSILLPEKKVKSFKSKLALLTNKERMVWQRYQIKQGDNLGKIALKFHIDVNSIKTINNISGSTIRAGKHLLIPVTSQDGDYVISKNLALIAKQTVKPKVVKTKRIHIVKPGDTLWDISKTYNVNSKNITRWNKISSKSVLKLGQKLVIWKESAPEAITYKVKRGDSFARIANKFKVSIKELEMWNNLTRKEYLQPGQTLKVALL
jgi:membrane-bound lytic murein transglycosylase D